MSGLEGKVALVTGGSRGIGAAIALKLAEQGADVALTYSASPDRAAGVAREVEALGRRALVIKADNRKATEVQAAVEQTVSKLGRLDVLVNNAGIFLVGPTEELSVEDFDETVAVNVRAAFVASSIAARSMGEGGRIISIGSNLATRATDTGLSLYSMSKAALVGMTKGFARDLGARGITANVVHPGSTDTDMNPADGAHADGQRQLTAMGRFGTPQEVAALVGWLAGPDGRNVTGAEFTIDGGANA